MPSTCRLLLIESFLSTCRVNNIDTADHCHVFVKLTYTSKVCLDSILKELHITYKNYLFLEIYICKKKKNLV
jgi:hypothetical protein